jgi:hypothetical protein
MAADQVHDYRAMEAALREKPANAPRVPRWICHVMVSGTLDDLLKF